MRKLALAAEIVATYVRVRVTLRRYDLPTVLKAHRRVRGTPPAEPLARARWLAGAAVRVLHRLPTDSRCLYRALVVSSVLARRGLPSKLVIGVRPGGDFAAHAWVEVDGTAVLPPLASEYQRLTEL